MGCDINLWIESKNSYGAWEPIEIDEDLMPIERDYDLFGFLCNVRGHCNEPLCADRGIPRDSSKYDQIISNLDLHSHTHVYLDEIWNANWSKAELLHCYFYVFFRCFFERIIKHGYISSVKARDYRVLIAFDS